MDRPRTPWYLRRWLVMTTAGIVCLCWVTTLCAVLSWGLQDDARPADAIVVMGAAQYAGHPSPALRARLDHAVTLWERGLAPRMILTGGTGTGETVSEAAVSRTYVLSRGVSDTAILLENEGRTSSESLHSAAELMHARGMHEAIIVSDPFHMLRLRILARRFGFTPYTSPTRTSPISPNREERWKYIFSESLKAPMAFFFERKL
jgi:uncharacterized SAM-binding protein YcdF (DUF218 family)